MTKPLYTRLDSRARGATYGRWAILRVVAAISWVVVWAPSVARAQEVSAYEQATQRAVVEFNHGNWEEAQALFRRAHELEPNARTWRGLGLCAFELRQYVRAVGELEAALIDPRKPLTSEQRDHAKTLLTQARDFVSIYHLRVVPPNAEVFVDGRLTKLDHGELRLDPGPHSVLVRAAGYEERRADFRAGAGEQDELSIELSLVGREDTQKESSERLGAPSAPRKRRHVWTWTLGGAAVAAAATAVGLRLALRGPESDHDACRDAGGLCGPLQRYVDRRRLGVYGVAAASGALVLGATLSFWLEHGEQNRRATSVSLGADGLHLRGSF